MFHAADAQHGQAPRLCRLDAFGRKLRVHTLDVTLRLPQRTRRSHGVRRQCVVQIFRRDIPRVLLRHGVWQCFLVLATTIPCTSMQDHWRAEQHRVDEDRTVPVVPQHTACRALGPAGRALGAVLNLSWELCAASAAAGASDARVRCCTMRTFMRR